MEHLHDSKITKRLEIQGTLIGLFYYASRNRKGRQPIQNRLLFMRVISYQWNTDEKLSNDILRIKMKRTFFPYFKDKIIQDKPDGVTSGFFLRVGQQDLV